MLLSPGQRGKAWEPYKKVLFSEIERALDRNVLSLFFKVLTNNVIKRGQCTAVAMFVAAWGLIVLGAQTRQVVYRTFYVSS
jgi:hypothetical protein